MKSLSKILLATTLVGTAALAAPASLSEVSPKNYGKQVFGLSLGTEEGESVSYPALNKDRGDIWKISISNKATLNKFNFSKGEWYWRGEGSYGLGGSDNASSMNFEVGTGVSYNLEVVYPVIDIAYQYETRTNDSDLDFKQTGWEQTTGFGIPITKKIETGVFYKYSAGTISHDSITNDLDYTAKGFYIPITYNAHKDIAITFSYSQSDYELDAGGDYETEALKIGISWQY